MLKKSNDVKTSFSLYTCPVEKLLFLKTLIFNVKKIPCLLDFYGLG